MFGLLQQHQMLYYKLLSLRSELPQKEAAPGSPDIRDEIHSYFFTQGVVGRRHDRKKVLLAYRVMLFATFIAAPIFLLFYFQARFLPYHSEAITWWHRLNVIFGAGALLWLGRDLCAMDDELRKLSDLGIVRRLRDWVSRLIPPFLSRIAQAWCILRRKLIAALMRRMKPSERRTLRSFVKTLGENAHQLGSFVCTMLFLSICVASVPDDKDDYWITVDRVMGTIAPKQLVPLSCYESYGSEERPVFFLTALLHEPPRDEDKRCWVQHWLGISRNLLLADQDITKDKDIVESKNKGSDETDIEYVHVLRDRDLRYADFRRSDMKWIDFEKAKLQNSFFNGSNLKNSRFRTARLQGADLLLARLQGADLRGARLQGRQPSLGQAAGRLPSPGQVAGRRSSLGQAAGRRPSLGQAAGRQPSPGQVAGRRSSRGRAAGRQPSLGQPGIFRFKYCADLANTGEQIC